MPPNTPTLAVVDNADGTATATVASGSGGASHQFQAWTFANLEQLAAGAWTNVESAIVGNGTIDLTTLDPGVYWGIVKATLTGEVVYSAPVHFTVTDSTSSYHSRILDAIVDRIISLSLPGIEDDHVERRPVAYFRKEDTELGLPLVVVCPGPNELVSPTAGTNVRDDVGYPVLICIWARGDGIKTTEETEEAFYLWRQRIIQSLNQQRLSPIAQVSYCRVDPLTIMGPQEFHGITLIAGGLLVRAFVRQGRGLNPAN